jgi:signal transduction histidine kinase
LALVKDEMSLRFSSAGIHFTILEDLVVPDYPLVADRSYHLTRIFREITSNILNHAAATEVSFLTQINEEGQKTELIVEVSDNGIGFDPAMGFGNGIANIRFRAESIGASVDWLSAQNPSDKQQGCTFTVCFPLDVTAQA